MKRRKLFIFLVILNLISLSACTQDLNDLFVEQEPNEIESDEVSIVGKWDYVTYFSDGDEDKDELEGITSYIEFNDDNTGKAYFFDDNGWDDNEEFEWEQNDDKITLKLLAFEDSYWMCKLDGDTLYLYDDEVETSYYYVYKK